MEKNKTFLEELSLDLVRVMVHPIKRFSTTTTSPVLGVWMCVRGFVGLAGLDAARWFQKWWACGCPCGNVPGDQHSGTPAGESAPGHTNTDSGFWQRSLWLYNPTAHFYLPVWIDEQQVAHGGSLHTTEDKLTRRWSALSHQEITATGEKGLCLLSV